MALMDNLFERVGRLSGIGIALGVVAATPILAKTARPLLKSAIKGYLNICDKTREAVAEANERLQDLYAEAKAEYQHSLEIQSTDDEYHVDETAEPKRKKTSVKKKKAEVEDVQNATEENA